MNDLNAFTGLVRRCVEDYDMIAPGDTVAVGVSGGKDSLVLLMALNELRRYYPKPFTLEAITVELGFDGMDFAPVAELCDTLGVPYTRLKTDIKEVVFDVRKEDNPCSLCAKMRRGALCTALSERGITKLALGHHFDDAVETFLLSLVYEGRISCFQPVTNLDRTGVIQIRPMLYLSEKTIAHFAAKERLPVVHNPCPAPRQPYISVRPMPGTLRVMRAREPLIFPSSPRTATASHVHMGFCLAQRLLCAKLPFGWLCTNASYSASVLSVINSYMAVHLQIHIKYV